MPRGRITHFKLLDTNIIILAKAIHLVVNPDNVVKQLNTAWLSIYHLCGVVRMPTKDPLSFHGFRLTGGGHQIQNGGTLKGALN